MIKQGPDLEKWIAFQRTNPPKGRTWLEYKGARCCLGNACHLFIPELATPDTDIAEAVRYDGKTGLLPPSMVERLGIHSEGEFTDEGVRFTGLFLRENNVRFLGLALERCNGLAAVNDKTEADHALIGDLIEHLAHVEREQGIECFAAP